MNCVIIEDELANQELIRLKLNKFFPEITILKIIDNKKEAVDFLTNSKVDFIFLDIQIKGGTGFDVLSSVKNNEFDIIFITAFDEFALEAFQLQAIHYLLKPFRDDDFKEAVHRIVKKRKTALELQATYLSIPFKNEIFRIQMHEIIFCKSDGSYTEIYLEGKKHISSKSIGEIEKTLDSNHFVRVHHSYIVNKNKIEKIEKGRSGNISLQGSHSIPISQRKMTDFLDFLTK